VAPLGAAAQTAPASGVATVPVTGTTDNGGAFNGTYTIQKFASQGDQLLAIGTLTGTLTDASGAPVGNVADVPVQIPVTAASGSCAILDLTLGPLDLNLLGLAVHLNTVHLTINAQSAPGALLGNLLCSVANLLNSGAPLGSLSDLLNQILGLL
jgi:hypothetical protein